jgi:hypothetical protein
MSMFGEFDVGEYSKTMIIIGVHEGKNYKGQ